ncbi:MAG: response regulator transcription factor [Burkholderiaceae bacterium]
MIKIVIADDHTIVREGLRRVIRETDNMEVIGDAANGHEVLKWVKQGGFDLLLLDLSMPEHSGVDFIKRIKHEAPMLPVLVLTMHEEESYAVRCIRAGASGYLTKDSASSELISAIQRIASGHLYINATVAEKLALETMTAQNGPAHKSLSDREFEVFQMMVHGHSVTHIANLLHLSVKTVSTHKARIMQKMNLPSFADLVRYAISNGLIDSPSR